GSLSRRRCKLLGQRDWAGHIAVIAVPQDQDAARSLHTLRLETDRPAELVGFAHLRRVQPERLSDIRLQAEAFGSDAPEKDAGRTDLTVPLDDGGHRDRLHHSPPKGRGSATGSGRSWSLRSSSPGV